MTSKIQNAKSVIETLNTRDAISLARSLNKRFNVSRSRNQVFVDAHPDEVAQAVRKYCLNAGRLINFTVSPLRSPDNKMSMSEAIEVYDARDALDLEGILEWLREEGYLAYYEITQSEVRVWNS